MEQRNGQIAFINRILGFSELCFGEYLFITWTTIRFNAGTFENVAELFDIE